MSGGKFGRWGVVSQSGTAVRAMWSVDRSWKMESGRRGSAISRMAFLPSLSFSQERSSGSVGLRGQGGVGSWGSTFAKTVAPTWVVG